MGSDLVANIWGVLGASGTGKGLWIKKQLNKLKPKRLVVWDFMDEYGEFGGLRCTSLRDVRAALMKAGGGPMRVRYVTGAAGSDVRKEFEVICELVYAWGGCVFIAEELANVTTPSWAPAAWRKMTTSGRHRAVHIIGASQTPALVDKSFLGNCTLMHVSALRQASHRKAVSEAMDIDVALVAALLPLEYIEKDFSSGKVTTGRVAIPGGGGKPATKTPKTKA